MQQSNEQRHFFCCRDLLIERHLYTIDQEGEEALQHDRAAEGGGAEEAGWHRGSQDCQAPYRCTTSKVFFM